MKFIFVGVALLVSGLAYAAKSGDCTMGSGENQVKMFVTLFTNDAEVSYEGNEEDKTLCSQFRDSKYDYNLRCVGDEEEDALVIRIKGSSGSMIDNEGFEVAKLKRCRIK